MSKDSTNTKETPTKPSAPDRREPIESPVSNTATPTRSTIQLSIPSTAAPSTVQQSVPNTTQPLRSAVKQSVPNTADPSRSSVQQSVPNTAGPSRATVQYSLPSTAAPSISTVRVSVPNTAAPSRSTVQQSGPNTAVPSRATIQISVPSTTASSRSGVQQSAPNKSAPPRSSLQQSIPNTAVPSRLAMPTTTPPEQSPQEAAPNTAEAIQPPIERVLRVLGSVRSLDVQQAQPQLQPQDRPLAAPNTTEPSETLIERALTALSSLRSLDLNAQPQNQPEALAQPPDQPSSSPPGDDPNPPAYPNPPFFSKTSFIQLGYGVWVNLGLLVVGMAFGYSSVAIPMLLLDKEMVMSENEISWFASILTLSSPVGCIASGYICDKLGRRMALIVAEIPMVIGWLMMAMANNPIALIMGRCVVGVGLGSVMPPSRVYTSEISLPNMRGTIGTFLNLAMAIGISCIAVLGMFLQWRALSYISFVFSSILLVMNVFLPETPYFVLMTDTEEKARETLEKFRSKKHDIDAEMKELIKFKNTNSIRKLTPREKMKALMKPASCIPFWIMNGYAAIVQLAGVTVLCFWTVVILENSKSSVDAKLGNTLVAIFRIFGSTLSSIMTYSCKRRTLTFLSGIGVTITFGCMALNYMLTDKPSLLPLICVTACVIFACIGYYSMPLLMMAELYPLQVRGILGGLSVSFMNLAIFAANMAFSPMMINWGFGWTMLQYAVWSLLGVVVLYFVLPETKDLTLQEIEEYYNKRRPPMSLQSIGTPSPKKIQEPKSALELMARSATVMNITITRNEKVRLKST